MERSLERAAWMEDVLAWLDEHAAQRPSLEEMAAFAGMSPSHFQRVFTSWVGLSPRRLLAVQATAHARQLLMDGQDVLSAAVEADFSGPGRLHDHCVTLLAATPGEVRSGGAGVVIRYGVHPSPFGRVLLGVTERGVAALAFLSASVGEADALTNLRKNWPKATLEHAPGATGPWAEQIFAGFFAAEPGPSTSLPVFVRGTQFQVRVWEALLQIPLGETTTYGQIAHSLGAPKAARAVGQAVGSNPVSLLIPCHRVIRQSSLLGGYRWGLGAKRALLASEAETTYV